MQRGFGAVGAVVLDSIRSPMSRRRPVVLLVARSESERMIRCGGLAQLRMSYSALTAGASRLRVGLLVGSGWWPTIGLLRPRPVSVEESANPAAGLGE